MDVALFVAAAFLPIVLAPLSAIPLARWLPLLAVIPALAAALMLPLDIELKISWLLLGVHLQMDAIGQVFLLFSALIWFFAALFLLRVDRQQSNPVLYRVFFLAAMGGNLLLILAADMITFYVGFALMGLSAYPLVLRRSQHARHAGRIYLAFTLIGELALFSAMAILFISSGSLLFTEMAQTPVPPAAIALLLFGFGIKVALPGIHSWLPMVYSTAPLVTAAVLSGPMMKAGLLGWLRFIPAGQQDLQFWGELLTVLGVLGIVMGVAVGLLQRDPRAVLGYSSIAKMGLISALFGQAMAAPVLAPMLIVAIIAFAMHHLLVKSSLFLALMELQHNAQRWVLLTIALLAISLVGAPLSGGAAVKIFLKDALGGELVWLLSVSAVGTTLLMVRFLFLLPMRSAGRIMPRPGAWPWLLLLPLAFWGPFLPGMAPLSLAGLGPLLVSLPLAVAGWWLGSRYPGLALRIPAGDIVHPLLRHLPRGSAGAEKAEEAARDWKSEWRNVWSSVMSAQDSSISMILPGVVLLVLFLLLLGSLILPLAQ